ncbi:MAG: hypothetical protein QF738_04060 [Rhodospirillales bacterium]|jgi:hypothetical protein|nr:hypothetical protein [Rhodospirillales bacterium]
MTSARVTLAATTLAVMASYALAAEMVVVASTAPGIEPGQVVESSARFKVPAGATVTLISQSGKPVIVKGPFAGAPSGNEDAKGDTSVVSSLAKLFSGPGAETSGLGAMRSTRTKGPPEPWLIDVSRSGNHCVSAPQEAAFWRRANRTSTTLGLRQLSQDGSAEVNWLRGADTLRWPEDFPLVDGGEYIARLKHDNTARKIIVHVAPAGLPGIAHEAAWMAEQGCTTQAKALLAGFR